MRFCTVHYWSVGQICSVGISNLGVVWSCTGVRELIPCNTNESPRDAYDTLHGGKQERRSWCIFQTIVWFPDILVWVGRASLVLDRFRRITASSAIAAGRVRKVHATAMHDVQNLIYRIWGSLINNQATKLFRPKKTCITNLNILSRPLQLKTWI